MKQDREENLQKEIAMALSRKGHRFWINDNGLARGYKTDQVFRYGLGRGISDLVGFASKEISGHIIPVFAAIEVKTAKGRLSKEQKAYIKFIKSIGGIAGVARSVEEAERLVEEWDFR